MSERMEAVKLRFVKQSNRKLSIYSIICMDVTSNNSKINILSMGSSTIIDILSINLLFNSLIDISSTH